MGRIRWLGFLKILKIIKGSLGHTSRWLEWSFRIQWIDYINEKEILIKIVLTVWFHSRNSTVPKNFKATVEFSDKMNIFSYDKYPWSSLGWTGKTGFDHWSCDSLWPYPLWAIIIQLLLFKLAWLGSEVEQIWLDWEWVVLLKLALLIFRSMLVWVKPK